MSLHPHWAEASLVVNIGEIIQGIKEEYPSGQQCFYSFPFYVGWVVCKLRFQSHQLQKGSSFTGTWESGNCFAMQQCCYSRSWTAGIMQGYGQGKGEMESALPPWTFNPGRSLQAAVIFRVPFESLSRAALNFPQMHENHWLRALQTQPSVQWPVLCHVRGFHPAGACPDPWRDLYLLSVSLSTDGIIGQSFITKLDLVWLDCEVDTGQHGSGCDSTSARVGGWFLVTGRICSTAQGTRDLLTWCSLQFLHSCQVFWDGNLAEEAPFKSGCSVSLSIINFNLPLSFS